MESVSTYDNTVTWIRYCELVEYKTNRRYSEPWSTRGITAVKAGIELTENR